MKRYSALLLLLALFTSCDIVQTEFSEIDYDTLQFQTQVAESGVFIFNDYESWSMFYLRHYTGITNNNPTVAPMFDFELNTLVGIFWDTQPRGCTHDVEAVKRVERRSNIIRVTVGPLPDLGACSMVTYPQQYLLLPRRTRHVQFVGDVPGKTVDASGSS